MFFSLSRCSCFTAQFYSDDGILFPGTLSAITYRRLLTFRHLFVMPDFPSGTLIPTVVFRFANIQTQLFYAPTILAIVASGFATGRALLQAMEWQIAAHVY